MASSPPRDRVVSVITAHDEEGPSTVSRSSKPSGSPNTQSPSKDVAEKQQWEPKHERFAQLLHMREHRRNEVVLKFDLTAADEVVEEPKSAKTLKRSASMSSFAALPTSTQQLRKIMASIENAQEEEKEEHARRLQEIQMSGLSGTTNARAAPGNSSSLMVLTQLISTPNAAIASSSSSNKSATGVSFRHQQQVSTQRTMTSLDFALKHHIRVYPSDSTGVEALTGLVEGGGSSVLVPPEALQVPDEPIVYEMSDVAAARGQSSKGNQKKKLGGGSSRVAVGSKRGASFGAGGTEASFGGRDDGGSGELKTEGTTGGGLQGLRGTRLPIQEMMRSYEDHCYVMDAALKALRQTGGDVLNDKMTKQLAVRHASRYLEPIPGIKTLLYFPGSEFDTAVRLPEAMRARQLESVARIMCTRGLHFHPVVWEFLTSQQLGCLFYGSYRAFPSVFEYNAVITPRQLYLNLERMSKGLVSPLVLRRIVYRCFDRPVEDLEGWLVLYKQYMAAIKSQSIASWFTQAKSRLCEKDARIDAELMSPPDPSLCAACDTAYADLSPHEDNPLCPESDVWRHPFGLVDCLLQAWTAGNATSLNQQHGTFRVWFHKKEAPVERVAAALHRIIQLNTSGDQMLDSYLCLHPTSVTAAKASFREWKEKGFLPPDQVWIPPNVTLKNLEELENRYSAKASNDRECKVLMNFISHFRMTYHSVISEWTGEWQDEDSDDHAWLSSINAKTALVKFRDPPQALLQVVKEEMHPEWPPVLGWEKKDQGGFAPRAGSAQGGGGSKSSHRSKNKDSKKSGGIGSSLQQKTVVQSELEPLESVGSTPFPPSASSNNNSKGKNATVSPLVSPLLEDVGILSTSASVGESMELLDPSSSKAATTVARPHEDYTEWDLQMLYGGQGMYFEGFMKMFMGCPVFARDAFGLVLRHALYV